MSDATKIQIISGGVIFFVFILPIFFMAETIAKGAIYRFEFAEAGLYSFGSLIVGGFLTHWRNRIYYKDKEIAEREK